MMLNRPMHPKWGRGRIHGSNHGRNHTMPRYLRAAALLIASVVVKSCAPIDALNATIATDGVSITRDVAYAPGPRGGMDVYRPDAAPGPLPLIVFLYGGSWQTGSKNDYAFAAIPLAKSGAVVAVPDYRLFPEVSFPTFLDDCAAAVAFARAHAIAWGADPNRLTLIGHSAGGYNALMLALDPVYLARAGMRRADLASVVSIAGPADFLPIREADIRAVFATAHPLEVSQPINHVDGTNPPLLLLHGERDTLVGPGNSIRLDKKIRSANGKVTLRLYPDTGHIGIITSLAPLFRGNAPVLADIKAFMAENPGP